MNVFAAASLTESFTELGKKFEKQHPGTKVVFNFGGSDSLAAGITNGAPADVFASASPKTMKVVTDAGAAAGTPATFVRNRLEIATLPGNPDQVASLKDLTGHSTRRSSCATRRCRAARPPRRR
ncbi:Molybdate ABC transporter substrate-binding protein OS=Streptomyces tendae OX=1932 GN=modA PE=3 SV=1 [Streptomyces tendae]